MHTEVLMCSCAHVHRCRYGGAECWSAIMVIVLQVILCKEQMQRCSRCRRGAAGADEVHSWCRHRCRGPQVEVQRSTGGGALRGAAEC